MDIEQIREYLLSLPYVTEDLPFDETTLVFRLHGKIFGCLALERPDIVVLKCDPERAIELRERYSEIEGAYHWNKKFWNQIPLSGSVPEAELKQLARHAYNEIVKKLPKKMGVATIEE